MNTFSQVQDGFHIKTSRRIAICLTFNDENGRSNRASFYTPSSYFESGTSDTTLPNEFTSGQSIVWGARNSSGPFVLSGTVGVFAYNSNDGDTLAVMWSVPFDFNLYSSWWNVEVYSGTVKANREMYNEMYKNAEFRGDNNWYGPKELSRGYTITGSMANSSVTSLEIRVTKRNKNSYNNQ